MSYFFVIYFLLWQNVGFWRLDVAVYVQEDVRNWLPRLWISTIIWTAYEWWFKQFFWLLSTLDSGINYVSFSCGTFDI